METTPAGDQPEDGQEADAGASGGGTRPVPVAPHNRAHDLRANPKRRRRRRILRWTSLGVVTVLAAAAAFGYLKYRSIDHSIHRVPLTDLGHRPPVYSTSSMNVLVFGSDSRTGLDHHLQHILHTGSNTGENNTDTIMVVHISPGRHGITVMSIPRDTMVPQYQCDSGPGYPGQAADPANLVMINSLLSAGGPSCLFKTVEQQTGIHLDHFIQLGMLGFVKVINDLGGVSVCVPFNVNDPVSGLALAEGEHRISGTTALAFWRTREDIGNGSDLERIQRDQFMSAQVVKGLLGSNLMSDPLRLLHLVQDAAASMTTDDGLSLLGLWHIAQSFHSLTGRHVQFITAPNQPWPGNQNRLEFAQPMADTVFSEIAHDITVPKTVKTKAPVQAVADASPAQVKVQVQNGSGVAGIAGNTAAALSSRGFDVTGTGDAASFGYTESVIEYASAAQLPEVNTLSKAMGKVKLVQDANVPIGQLDLIVGTDYNGLAAAPNTSASASPSTSASANPSSSASPTPTASPQQVESLATATGGITANASCSADAAAFAGS